ncbi:MAG: hypothetical protein IJR28_07545 [Ottowia sp.]|nr:hypothetical protein [Ottowia sp.]
MNEMSAFRLLIVEDDEQDLTVCRTTVARYVEEKEREINLVECKSVEEAFDKLDNSFDGAIIDLKLGKQGDEGNQVISRIKESFFKIPMVILTGTPNAVDHESNYIKSFKKGEPGSGYADLLDYFWEIYITGLTRIMGGRGTIEEELNKVFTNSILPQIDTWIKYGKASPDRTEKSLLRHTLNHLLLLLDDDDGRSFPEEIYLQSDKIRTGSIVQQKGGGWFVVMTPACDLVIRGSGKPKADHILLVGIDKVDNVVNQAQEGVKKRGKKKDQIKELFRNNYRTYYHCLPKTVFFIGGFLNFRKVLSISTEEFYKNFIFQRTQISPPFVKDIVARFSSYYARQGQPDIDCDTLIDEHACRQDK